MDRRDRDNRGAGVGARRNEPNARVGQGNGQAAQPRRAPVHQAAPQIPSYEDPNAYRSPGFQDQSQSPYRIDYAGLPKDDEDPEGKLLQPGPGNARFGNNSNVQHPRGMNGRRPDRAGTDPNAYRSPGFRDDPSKNRRPPLAGAVKLPQADVDDTAVDTSQAPLERATEGSSRRERRAQRPRFETTCQACGAAAVVPFEPGPERPAFCKPCYEVKRDELGLGPGKRPAVTPGL